MLCVLQYGFLAYEVEDGRKLFFHMSDVIGEDALRQGDDVEFVVVCQKDGKHSARQLRKIAWVANDCLIICLVFLLICR